MYHPMENYRVSAANGIFMDARSDQLTTSLIARYCAALDGQYYPWTVAENDWQEKQTRDRVVSTCSSSCHGVVKEEMKILGRPPV